MFSSVKFVFFVNEAVKFKTRMFSRALNWYAQSVIVAYMTKI